MTHHSLAGGIKAVPATTMSRLPLPPMLGNLAGLRSSLADKRRLVARTEAAWVAKAEAELAKHLPKGVRIDDRETWDGPTYTRYLTEAEKVEPEFKPRLRRLLTEIEALQRLLSPSPNHRLPDAA